MQGEFDFGSLALEEHCSQRLRWQLLGMLTRLLHLIFRSRLESHSAPRRISSIGDLAALPGSTFLRVRLVVEMQ